MLKKLTDEQINLDILARVIEKLPDANPDLRTAQLGVFENCEKADSFNMRTSLMETPDCGTVCCILGVAKILFGEGYSYKLGKDISWLFLSMPLGYRDNIYTAKDAAKVLDHLKETGIVDWSITGKNPQNQDYIGTLYPTE